MDTEPEEKKYIVQPGLPDRRQTDTLGITSAVTDTLLFRAKSKKSDSGRNKGGRNTSGRNNRSNKNEEEEKTDSLPPKYRVKFSTNISKSDHNLNMPIKLTFEAPILDYTEDKIEVVLNATGRLTLHGVTHPVSNIKVFLTYITEGPVTRKNRKLEGDLLHLTAEMSFKLSDFDISIPTENLLTLDDNVNIIIDAFGTTRP